MLRSWRRPINTRLVRRLAVGFREQLCARLANEIVRGEVGLAIGGGDASRRSDPARAAPRSIPCGDWRSLASVSRYGPMRSRASTIRSGRNRRAAANGQPAKRTRDEHPSAELAKNFPIEPLRRLSWDDRRRILRHVAHRERIQREIVVPTRQRRGRRQQDVRVACRLVEIAVDRDDVLERGERAIEAPPVRRRQHRIAGDGDERAHAPAAVQFDFVGERGDRQVAAELRQLTGAAAPPIVGAAHAEPRQDRHDIDGRRRQHHAADLVEMTGDEIERLHQPRRRACRAAACTVRRGRNTRRASCAGELAGEPARGRRRRRRSGERRAPARARGRASARASRLFTRPSKRPRRVHPSAKTTCSMAASSSASVPGRMATCSSAISAVSVRRGSTTTMRPPRSRMARSRPLMFGAVIRLPFDTIGFAPKIEEQIGPIEIGHRNEREMPEHAKRGEHLRQLIGRARRIDVPGPQRPRKRQRVGQQSEVVRDRIAVVHRDRVAPVVLADARGDRRPPDPARPPTRPRASSSLPGSWEPGCDRDRRGDRRARRLSDRCSRG